VRTQRLRAGEFAAVQTTRPRRDNPNEHAEAVDAADEFALTAPENRKRESEEAEAREHAAPLPAALPVVAPSPAALPAVVPPPPAFAPPAPCLAPPPMVPPAPCPALHAAPPVFSLPPAFTPLNLVAEPLYAGMVPRGRGRERAAATRGGGRGASAPAPAPAAVRDASFTARARALLKEIPPHVRDGFSELAAERDDRSGKAQGLVDAIEALEVSVGTHGRPEVSVGTHGRPVPSAAAFASDGGASSAASGNAPRSGNPAPRRRRLPSTADDF